MVYKIISAAVCATLGLAAFANAGAAGPRAHVHGVAALEAALEGHTLDLRLDTPLANLLRFEHRPVTPAELAAVRNMRLQLADPGTMFGLPDAAGCRIRSVKIEAPSLDQDASAGPAASKSAREVHARHDHTEAKKTAGPSNKPVAGNEQKHIHDQKHEQEHGHDHGHEEDHRHDRGHDAHADLTATYVFECRRPAALSHIDAVLFRTFPGIAKIDVQSVGPKGQSATVLTKTVNRLAW